jgi:membrane protein implicated in regulation of membrane protease activity
MQTLRSLLFFLLIFAVILLLLLGGGIAVGFLLRWFLPAVELGTAVLVGLVATGLSVAFLAKLLGQFSAHIGAGGEEDEGLEILVVPPLPRRKRRRPKS